MNERRRAFLDGIAWMSERTYLSDTGGYHVHEPSELDIRRAADAYAAGAPVYPSRSVRGAQQ